jgi:hypothetical protein
MAMVILPMLYVLRVKQRISLIFQWPVKSFLACYWLTIRTMHMHQLRHQRVMFMYVPAGTVKIRSLMTFLCRKHLNDPLLLFALTLIGPTVGCPS